MGQAAEAEAEQAQPPQTKETKRAAAAAALDCLGREQTARVPRGQTLPVEVAAALVEVRGPQERTKLYIAAAVSTILAVGGTVEYMVVAVGSDPISMEPMVTAQFASFGPVTQEHSHLHA